MTLSTQTILNLAQALASLTSHTDTVKDGESEKTMQKPYKFAPKVQLAIAKNLAHCQNVVAAYQKVREGVILSVSGGKANIEPPPPPPIPADLVGEKRAAYQESAEYQAKLQDPAHLAKIEEFTAQITEYNRINQLFLDEKHDITLVKLSEADLKLDVNPIPLTTLAAMGPIMEDGGWEAEPGKLATHVPEPSRGPKPKPNGRAHKRPGPQADPHDVA